MPGLIIIIQKKNDLFHRNRNVIHEMTKTIMHESFYKSQFMEIPELGLHASKVYLDHQYSPKQISRNEDESIQCMFSGELYGSSEIMNELLHDKHIVRNQNDISELIIHLYEEKREKFLRHLNG